MTTVQCCVPLHISEIVLCTQEISKAMQHQLQLSPSSANMASSTPTMTDTGQALSPASKTAHTAAQTQAQTAVQTQASTQAQAKHSLQSTPQPHDLDTSTPLVLHSSSSNSVGTIPGHPADVTATVARASREVGRGNPKAGTNAETQLQGIASAADTADWLLQLMQPGHSMSDAGTAVTPGVQTPEPARPAARHTDDSSPVSTVPTTSKFMERTEHKSSQIHTIATDANVRSGAFQVADHNVQLAFADILMTANSKPMPEQSTAVALCSLSTTARQQQLDTLSERGVSNVRTAQQSTVTHVAARCTAVTKPELVVLPSSTSSMPVSQPLSLPQTQQAAAVTPAAISRCKRAQPDQEQQDLPSKALKTETGTIASVLRG